MDANTVVEAAKALIRAQYRLMITSRLPMEERGMTTLDVIDAEAALYKAVTGETDLEPAAIKLGFGAGTKPKPAVVVLPSQPRPLAQKPSQKPSQKPASTPVKKTEPEKKSKGFFS